MHPRNSKSGVIWCCITKLVLFTPMSLFAGTPEAFPEISIPLSPETLKIENFYYFRGHSGVPDKANEGFTANAGFVITSEGVVVFDALGTPSLGAAMIEEIRDLTDQPITHVVLSHYHADHIYGLQAFRRLTDARIIAQSQSAHYLDSPEAQQRLDQRKQALSPWVDEHTHLVAPDETFESQLAFESGEYRFTVFHAGPAHSPDDSMMVVQPSGVLFSGDIIQSGRIPFLNSDEVDSENWMEAIEKVRKLEPSILVPGHGAASDDAMQALAFTYDYLAFVRDRMQKAVENWVSFEDAYKHTDWSRYETLPAFEASNKANAYRVYLEMERTVLGSE